jgi:hypothetical protein
VAERKGLAALSTRALVLRGGDAMLAHEPSDALSHATSQGRLHEVIAVDSQCLTNSGEK